MGNGKLAEGEVVVTGGCLCGKIRYQVTAEPYSVTYCHCRMCRRACGQPRLAGAYFKAADVAFSAGEAKLYRSSEYANRGFCGDCGTPLFYHSVMPELSDWMAIMLGTIDQAADYPPTDHYNIETALPHGLPDDGLPRHRQAESAYHWVRQSIRDQQQEK